MDSTYSEWHGGRPNLKPATHPTSPPLPKITVKVSGVLSEDEGCFTITPSSEESYRKWQSIMLSATKGRWTLSLCLIGTKKGESPASSFDIVTEARVHSVVVRTGSTDLEMC
jgi:hypothetical protein